MSVSSEDLSQVGKEFHGPIQFTERKESSKLVPQEGKRNILITSALPYVNNVPHLGTLIGCVLSADVFARYARNRGHETIYVCGTDEYGTATETKALQEGVTAKEICDKYYKIHKEVYEWFNIEFDIFGRTTTDAQTEIAQDMFLKLQENGFTSISEISQLYCENCSKFLADRFVTGNCPTPGCTYDDARGDQCDACGKLINAIDLKNPKCHVCKQEPKIRQSKHIFLDLDKLQPEVIKYVENSISRPDHRWSANAVAICKGWFNIGLEKRCITRDLKWGTAVPVAGFENKVFYVWYDAPIGYLSITKCLVGDNWTKWWKNPDNVECFNFVGKDNVAFHGVMFPCTQLGTRDNYTIVNNICATEYLNYEDTKFSKSRGTGVFGNDAKDTGIEPDVWRFYLLYMRPETTDTSFCWDDFAAKVNSELLANLGNFINRALSFLKSNFDGVVPEITLNDDDLQLLANLKKDTEEWDSLFDKVKLRDAVTCVLGMSRRCNQYMQAQQAWVLIKGSDAEKKRAGSVIGLAANLAYHLATVLYPIMPEVSLKIRRQCGLEKLPSFSMCPLLYLKPGHKIGEPSPLFAKMEKEKVEEFKTRYGSASSKNGDAKEVKKGKKGSGKSSPKETKKEDNMHFPALLKNHQTIQQALALNAKKFEQARGLFEKAAVAKLNEEATTLKKEVEDLQNKLAEAEVAGGKKQLSAPKRKADAASVESKIIPPTEQTQPQDAKQKKEKVEKKPQEAKKNAAPKKNDAAVDDAVDIGRLDLRVGRIIHCEKHPDADALYLEKIDVGEPQPRTVISGLVKWVPLEQMQNRLVVVMCNLKPAKMRGIESQAMVMCASTPEKVEIMEVDPNSQPGTPVICPPYVHRPDAVLNPKKKVWETVAEDLKVSADGIATWKGQPLIVGESSHMRAPTLRGTPIK